MLEITTENQLKLNSGACIDMTASDAELGIRALVGYHNYFHVGYSDAIQLVQNSIDQAGLNWIATSALFENEKIPCAIRVGQVCIHHGDRSYPLYVMPRN